MKVDIVYGSSPHQTGAGSAMAEGMRAHGLNVTELTGKLPLRGPKYRECDISVTWGERNRLHAAELAKNTLIFERGYFSDRMRFTSVGWNGLNGRADFCNDNSPPDRWAKHGVEAPAWRPITAGPGYILLLGQVPGDMSHRHINLDHWLAETASGLADRFPNKAAVYRPHPGGSGRAPARKVRGSLAEVLSGASWAVTFNSNSGVDAALSGCPVVVGDPGSMVWPIASHDVSAPPIAPTTERFGQWLNDLAYTQWLEAEIRSGECWEHLKQFVE